MGPAAIGALGSGRTAYAQSAWKRACDQLSRADAQESLEGEDLERLATSAYMLGREDDYLEALERAHRAHLDSGALLPAARCAIWVGIHSMRRGDVGPGAGWLARAQRLVEREGSECVERGYLLFPRAFRQEADGDADGAAATLAEIVDIGQRFSDADLLALALHEQGHMLVKLGRARDGIALLDESMVSVAAGELSPIVSGIVYCGVILGCQDAYEPRRAREWTAALTRWWSSQPDMVAFTGRCLIHRAEILQLQGAWPDALSEAKRAAKRSLVAQNPGAAGEALYRQGDLLRLRGEFSGAEEAYRRASAYGREPQPGLALMRLAQGRPQAAAGAIRRVVDEAGDTSRLAGLLPAMVEILVAIGQPAEAGAACDRLEEVSARYDSELLAAAAAQARGSVALAGGDPSAARKPLRRAIELWLAIEAPYEAARTRVLAGMACEGLGDADAAALELEAARKVFTELGATPDVARVDALTAAKPADDHGLTPRELEVLRMVAGGATNKAIAADLVLSERTVDRHVSNILAKLRLSSRAAATAYAYEHKLI